MAGAFQSSAFQNNAFQVGGVVPPVPQPSPGGGGSVQVLEGGRKRRRAINRMLEVAIREALEPTVVAEFTDPAVAKVGKVWTAPQKQTVFPDSWRQLQMIALMDLSMQEVQARINQIVAQQRALYQAQQAQAMVWAQDEDAARALLSLMVRDLI